MIHQLQPYTVRNKQLQTTALIICRYFLNSLVFKIFRLKYLLQKNEYFSSKVFPFRC